MTAYFKNVVLAKAEVDFFDASFFEANIPLCYLGAVIKNEVNSVSMPVDMRIDPQALEHLEASLEKMKKAGNPCDLVAISTMTASFPNAIKIAKIAKKYNAYVVVGGYHPSALPEQMFDYPEIDAVVRGEGEMTFKEFVVDGPSEAVNGLSFRDHEGIVHHNPDRDKITDLDSLPFPDRNLRPDNPIFHKHEVIVTSRGCDGTCTFCANGSVHGRWRGRSAENVVEELKEIYKRNPNLTVHIWDANFMDDGDRVEKIIQLIKANNIHFKYFCEMRVDNITHYPDLIRQLAEIGMEWIAIGIESPNQDRLKRLKKGITTNTVEQAINILKQNKIKIVGYLMIGDPQETIEQMKQYPVYGHEMGINKVLISIQTPHPGSQFFKDMEAQGGITSYDWEKYDIGHSVAKLDNMTNEQCEELMDWCWGKFYTPDWAITQCNTLKEDIYNYLVFAWFGYPGFLIHARPEDRIEPNLKAYINAMKGHYDLTTSNYDDVNYLVDLKGISFQVTFKFEDGSLVSFLTEITDQGKPIIDIFDGKKDKISIDFTIESKEFIKTHKAFPLQTASLVHWAGFNFDNFKANQKVISLMVSLFARSFQFKTFNWMELPKLLFIGSKFLPKRWFDLIVEEFKNRKTQTQSISQTDPAYQAKLGGMGSLIESGKKLLYKFLLFPFTAIVPID